LAGDPFSAADEAFVPPFKNLTRALHGSLWGATATATVATGLRNGRKQSRERCLNASEYHQQCVITRDIESIDEAEGGIAGKIVPHPSKPGGR